MNKKVYIVGLSNNISWDIIHVCASLEVAKRNIEADLNAFVKEDEYPRETADRKIQELSNAIEKVKENSYAIIDLEDMNDKILIMEFDLEES